ncbi:TatD family hydrolase [Sutterella sp.]|uniref:TatD family hydrolase n=1 Tax=Sutterella sp. TaxID=1981025 RepID=UPI0026E0C115|nr:TatD family hydrolase [Sutterella sp.]MDO5530530.1 TatD family hydrolase [Sutterella sp.]
MGIIDTHSHLQMPELDGRRREMLEVARGAGVEQILLCAGAPSNWELTARVAHETGLGYLLGIHPLALAEATPAALAELRARVREAMDDPFFIGVGEVGLDAFEPGIDQRLAMEVFIEELRIARDFDLPLSVHVRKTGSQTLGAFRRIPPPGGVIHAFNGSDAEREAFLARGMKLGFGGAATYAGSRRIRRHLAEVKDGDWVLETDTPDMPGSGRRDAFAAGLAPLATEPADIREYVRVASDLRGVSEEEVVRISRAAALRTFPRLEGLLAHPGAFSRRGV